MEEKKENDIYQKVKTFFSLQAIIGIVIGIIAGYLYYIKVGCTSGTCPITSSPWMSMLWGGIIGYLLGDMFTKKIKKEE
jgi:xanthine/uracil permease